MKDIEARKAGPYADVLMDRWFKRTFGWEPAKTLMKLFLKELIPERDIVDLSFGPQEYINPIEAGKDVRMDIDCTDSDGSRFIVEMQLAEQNGFYERAVFNSSFAVQQQIPVGKRKFSTPELQKGPDAGSHGAGQFLLCLAEYQPDWKEKSSTSCLNWRKSLHLRVVNGRNISKT